MKHLSRSQKLIYDMEKYSGGAISVICGSMLLRREADVADLQAAENELRRINAALRTHIVETDAGPMQIVEDYAPQDVKVLRFSNKLELTCYAEAYAKEPLPLYGQLCEFTVVLLPEQSGLLVKLHHIISDAWTLALLGTQCNAILRGETPSAYSYENHLQTEDAYLKSERCARDRAFFLQQFKKCGEVTYLSEKQSSSISACRKTFVIGREKTNQLVNYAKSHGASIFALFMTAVAAYFSRVTQNTEKFYLGTAVLNRAGAREKNTAGMFINMIPLLMELENTQTFSHNLEVVKAAAFATFRHQKFNYNDILTAIRQEYGSSERLYDVMFSYQNATIAGGDGGMESAWYHCGAQTESLQIHIDDRDNEGILCVHFDYQTEKFTEQEIERMYVHMLNLLFDAVEHEQKKLVELGLLTAEEKRQILYDFNNTAADYPRDKCVHTLFEEQAARTPDKAAVIACDRTLTYRELNEQANRVAYGLIAHGVKPGDIVAFMLPRRSYLIAAMFGILKTGATYLPIDPDYPRERIDYMLEDSKAAYLITEENVPELLKNGGAANPVISMTSDSLCYCLYTSGSTGQPKGALLRHRGIVNLVTNLRMYHELSNCKRIGFMTTITFDVATQEIFTALLNGFTGVLVPERRETGTDKIISNIQENEIDIIYATPTYLDALTNTEEHARAVLSSVKVICLAGEKFSLNRNVMRLRGQYPVILENQYGPVELHVIAVSTTLENDDFASIGRPIRNNQAYIVDKHINPVPIGVTGELCIAGDGVGAGYLNRPELTAEKFIDNPFGEGKLYKTGDLAYWREDGNIVYVGRNDFQVKLRGLRIELGEIENALQEVEGISQAAVVVRKNEAERQFICAFYTGQETDGKSLRAAIGKRLPKYMLPHSFTHLEAMPLTSSGKVSRKALPEVDLSSIAAVVEYAAPKSEHEIALCTAVQTVLHIEKAGTSGNFFDLGGDSLKAIELIAALEQAGYSTEVRTVFEVDTLGELAERLTTAETNQAAVIPNGPIPATDAQVRVYTAQAMAGGTTYNVPYAFRVEQLDPAKLQAAISGLVERHENLRTRFENKDGQVMQVVDDSVICVVETLDSEDISDFVRPFDLEAAPLLRVGYYQNTVMIDMHHIITDGGSMPVFLRELNELYMGRALGREPAQYREFAVQSRDHTQAEKYWLSAFSDEPPVLEMNTDYPRQGKQTFSGAALYKELPGSLHEQICKKCRTIGITPYAFYTGAFYVLLSKFSGNEDIVVGVPASGRSGKFLATIGMFVNTLALRGRPEGDKTVLAFLREIREMTVQALDNQEYPYGKLVKKLNVHTENRNPLFDIMFAYQSEDMTDVVFGDKPAVLLPIPSTSSKYDATINILPRQGNVVLAAEYCADLYKESTIRRLLDGYQEILVQMLDTGKLLKDLSAMTEKERRTILMDFNDTAVDYPSDKCVHQLFEEQAELIPEQTAVIACDRTLTYRELNEHANRIAHGLIVHGVKPGDIVAFALPRDSHMVPVMFGILKAGAAYLPIDPGFPQERISYMLEDSGARIFITKDNLSSLLENRYEENLSIVVPKESPCYCIYTSGSTGKPKGAILCHKNVVNYCNNNKKNFCNVAITSDCKRILSVTNSSFDIFLTETLLSLLNQITVFLATEDEILSQVSIASIIKQYSIDILQTTPTKLYSYLLDKENLSYLEILKVIILGGEVFPVELYTELKKHTKARIYNSYGPTETTVFSTTTLMESEIVTIGKPIANTQVYIVDKYMKPVPIGVIGEVCIAGDGVGIGYLNRPELTAEKFIPNPFGAGKLYKSGDLAYWREDGNIVYSGRNDFQVKIRGLRIELGEIENTIAKVDGISQVVTVVRKDGAGRQLICAFYTETISVELEAIKDAIREKLPHYMMPHVFVKLDTLPMTDRSKVDRKALPDVDFSAVQNSTEFIPPVGEREKVLAAIMEQVLGYSPIGREDNFFDLGGDSLKAIEFASKAHTDGVYFALQSIFDHPTIKTLCECIDLGDQPDVSYEKMDFARITPILAQNRLGKAEVPQETPVGNILLTGATGYLGIHLLADYLEHDSGIAYCLVRGNNQPDSEARLTQLLKFYFNERYTIGGRVRVICGDLQKDGLGLPEQTYRELQEQVDYVINAAASVKHYGSYRYFHEANVESTGRLVAFCKDSRVKLIHISTISVSGNSFADDFNGYISETEKHFRENDLYIGQPLNNVYTRSKFEAEKLVLEAMADGLPANIMRMGNLTNRFSDGVFQINHGSNAAARRLKGILELGLIPDYLAAEGLSVEFTPVDEAARAIMTLVHHFSASQTVFHINSTKPVCLGQLIGIFGKLGYSLNVADGVVFTEALRKTAEQPEKKHIFETFITDLDTNDRLNYESNIHVESKFTEEYLRRLGFNWSEIGIKYLRKYVAYFKKIGYWEA